MAVTDPIRPFFRAGRALVRDGLTAVDNWATDREYQRRIAAIDRELAKAAAEAQDAGLDGNHDFQHAQQGDNRAEPHDWRGEPPKPPHNPAGEPKALGFDPFDLVSLMGWREKPGAMTYVAIERVAAGVPVVTDVIRTRTAQVLRFCQRPDDRHSPGLKVRLRDRSIAPTPESDKLCRELEDVILQCGYTDPDHPEMGTPLKHFAAMFIRDSLTYDQATFEIVPDRLGRPSYFQVVDATTIRRVDPIVAKEDGVSFVQVIEGTVVADFKPNELAFCIRNPRSGIRSYGYGESEIESLIREITGFLWAIEYNRRFFSQGSTTKGILNFKGAIPDKHMQAFRRQWYAMVAGVANAWRTPITNADDLQWINLQMSNRDMEYGSWMDFLIKVVCARYLIAPEEVNFSYGNTGQSQAMGTAPIEEKLTASKDLGLKPLVQWLFTQLNTHFLQRIHPDFEVIPVGLDDKGAEAEADLLQKQVRIWRTVDEIRVEQGLDPMPDDKGKVILDPTWLQWATAKENPPDAGGDDGMPPGMDGGDNPDGEDGGDDDHPTGGIDINDEDGKPYNFAPADDDDEDGGGQDVGPPGVAKSLRPEVGSGRVVRYEIVAP